MDNEFEAYEKALEQKHDKLLYCSLYSSTMGMMINSDSILSYELSMKEGEDILLTIKSKKPFEKKYIKIYKLAQEDIRNLVDFIENSRFWAFSELKYHQDPSFVIYDYSSSTNLSLRYDDRNLGGLPFNFYTVSTDAMIQYGFEKQCDEYVSLIKGLEVKGEIIETSEEGTDSNFTDLTNTGSINDLKDNSISLDPGEVRCPNCGYHPVPGRFCPECGTKIKD